MDGRDTAAGTGFDHAAALLEMMVASGDYASAVAAVTDHDVVRWQRVVNGRTAATATTIFPLASLMCLSPAYATGTLWGASLKLGPTFAAPSCDSDPFRPR